MGVSLLHRNNPPARRRQDTSARPHDPFASFVESWSAVPTLLEGAFTRSLTSRRPMTATGSRSTCQVSSVTTLS